MKLGITATRLGLSGFQKREAFRQINFYFCLESSSVDEVHQGCCKGGDQALVTLVDDYFEHVLIIGHPPKDQKLLSNICVTLSDQLRDPKPYLDRNKDIVNETEVLIAFPNGPERQRSGTWSTVRYARKQDKRIVIVMPDKVIMEDKGLWTEAFQK